MLVTIPVPGLGNVTLFTAANDFIQLTCPTQITRFSIKRLSRGSVTRLTCNGSQVALVAWLGNLNEVNIPQIIEAILNLPITTVPLTSFRTDIRAQP